MHFVPERALSPLFTLITVGVLGFTLGVTALSEERMVQVFGLIVVLAATVLLLVAPLSTLYQVTPQALRIRWLFGWVTLPKEEILVVWEKEFRLGIRTFGIGVPGVAQGGFLEKTLGHIQAYTAKGAGRGVFVQMADGRKVLLCPAERKRFLDYLRQLGYPVQ